jgi:hypothetical protein
MINGDGDEKRHFCTAYAQMLCCGETLMAGSLHSSIVSYILISSRCHLSTWTKLTFSKDFLPPPSQH